VVGPLCMHVLTFLCRESAAATFLLPGYQHDHIVYLCLLLPITTSAAIAD